LSDTADKIPGETSGNKETGARVLVEVPRRAIDSMRADRSSLALGNLRGAFILVLLTFHSAIAYLAFAKAPSAGFDQSDFAWRAFPIVDSRRFAGFDILCAWQDVYLMSLMFFVSGLFAWPSLSRKGSARFLADRLLRLGAPFFFGVVVVVPIALYPAYRVTAIDPSLAGYLHAYLSLPFLPNGPLWFLWLLFAITLASVALHHFAPGALALLGRWSDYAATRPDRFFVALTAAAALAYIPLALVFTPWNWIDRGPFSFQLSRPMIYLVYYLAGLGVGVNGRQRGLLDPDGALARRWRVWGLRAFVSLLLWMGLTGWSLNQSPPAPLALQIAADLGYALAGTCSLYFVMALCLRFGAVRVRWLDGLSNNAMGIYVVHYAPVVWLQFALIDVHILAVAKAAIVFGGALFCSLAAAKALHSFPLGARLIGQVRTGPNSDSEQWPASRAQSHAQELRSAAALVASSPDGGNRV
jgi:hypothetical protein